VAIHTAFTERLQVAHPLVLAPMAAVSGGKLAAAVSNAGGLGLVGGGYGDHEWLERELEAVTAGTVRPWGAGLITWSATPEVLRLVLSYRPAAVLLSFGDPAPYAATIKQSGAALICQVQDVAGAREAAAAGADVIVAQGTEAGGHGGRRSTLPLVPAVADAVAPLPVLAAGGISDGRGLAAALMLGASGAVVGTRFCAAPEALYPDWAKARLAAETGDHTTRTRVFDAARGLEWPAAYTGRALRNTFTATWDGRETELASDASARQQFTRAQKHGDPDTALVWASEGIDLITAIEPAADLVDRIITETGDLLHRAPRLAG